MCRLNPRYSAEEKVLNQAKMADAHGTGTALYSAPFTPFDANGDVLLERIAPLAEDLIATGVRGVFVCGSNGEGPNMTEAERMALAETWVEASAGRLRVLVHVGHPSIAAARALTAHAAAIGADAASSVAAFYFKPDSVETLVDCMAEIAGGAPNLPFYYYHIPALTSVSLDMVRFLELADGRIGNLAGIKYTAPTLWEYQACLGACGGRFDVLFGLDEMLLPALSVGARAAIGSTYNFAAPLYLEVARAFEAGDIVAARAGMARLVEMVRVLLRFPPIPAQKEIMRHIGHDLGGSRLPLRRLSDDQSSSLIAQLEAIGFFDDLRRARARLV
jgi:N-acetylneuraminate lyase